MHKNVFESFPKTDINGSIVWINMLPEDSLEAALPTIKLLNDDRIQHFYDPNQISGKEIATSVGWDGHVAWDIYLFYPPTMEWEDVPPKPITWMHQVSDDWAKTKHYHTGDDLKRELTFALESLTVK
ncbi:MAG: hypothetical protein KJO26_04430 [Deltaproteobacteria bacterium]|nr:hypothetical protein [Deltaproteobacteria bacterium]